MSYKLAGVIWNDDGTMATEKPTPLEAFDKVLDIISNQRRDDNLQDCIDIVETALKENTSLKYWLNKERQHNKNNKKKLKAFEIIKTKEWLVEDIIDAFNAEKGQELLKEVLLCG